MSQTETSTFIFNLDYQVDSTKDDKLDKIFWFKFIFSLVAGVVFGVMNFTGFISFIIYFLISVILSFIYFNKFISNEEIDYQSEVFIEGLNVAVPSFLLLWIISYTITKSLNPNFVESEI